MEFCRKDIERFNDMEIPEVDLNELETGLVGNFGVVDTYRYHSCAEIDGEIVITDLLRITFEDHTEVIIFAE